MQLTPLMWIEEMLTKRKAANRKITTLFLELKMKIAKDAFCINISAFFSFVFFFCNHYVMMYVC